MRFTPRYIYSFLEKIAVGVFVALAAFVLRDREKAESLRKGFTQFFRYSFIGLSNTLLNYILYVASLNIIRAVKSGLTYDYMAASFISFSLCVFWSFFWNSRYVFQDGKENRKWAVALLKMYLAYSVSGILLNNLLLYLYISVWGISVYIAPRLSLIICVPVNFIMNKYWAFR